MVGTLRAPSRRVGKASRAKDNRAIDGRNPVWRLIEWRDRDAEPTNYDFCSLPGIERMTRRKLVRLVMQRWRTERAYEDLEGELGLDHDEGRRYFPCNPDARGRRPRQHRASPTETAEIAR